MRVSSARITLNHFVVLLIVAAGLASPLKQGPISAVPGTAAKAANENPADVFQRGQSALNGGRLDEAEREFRQVLQIDPRSGAAHANLGVVYMRRKQWSRALQELEQAEKLMPQVAGVRLNIGLAYYRQNEFLKAIPEFESVVRQQPDSIQPRYLLGLCYFFDERWADSANMLEPLWAQESRQLPYLYVLANAAHRAGRNELDQRAAEQLTKLGDGSPEYHLFAGKYYLNREQYDLAMEEFEAAAKQDAKLPFVHFNLGLTHLRKQQYGQARKEFLKDAAVEPDLALNYEEIGNAYWLTEDDRNAEKSYREALLRDPRRVDSMLGLAKIYQREQKYAAALAEADAALKVDPERTDAHYVRGQALLHLGRKTEANKELVAAAGKEAGGERGKQDVAVPSPELLQEQ